MSTLPHLHASSAHHGDHQRREINFVSVAVLIVAVIAMVLVLVGVFVRGTTPWVLAFPIALALVCLLDLRR